MSNSNWKIFFLEGDGNASCEKVQQGTEEHSSSPVPPHQLWFPLLNPIVNAAHEEHGGLTEMGGVRLSPSYGGS